MHRFRSRSVTLATLTLALIPLASQRDGAAAPPGPYVLADLGTLGGSSAQALDINDAGQVVGYATLPAGQPHPFIWQNGVMIDLGTLGGAQGRATAIDALGHVVGDSLIATGVTRHAFLWDNGGTLDLTPGSDGSSASGINDWRQVVGTAGNGSAFLWVNGAFTSLGHLGGGGSVPADINNTGQVVGSSSTTHFVPELGPLQHAFLWRAGVMTDLGVLPGDDESLAQAINATGQIVGSSGHTDPLTYEVTSHAFLYDRGAMTALPMPDAESYATDINDAGIVVGTMRGSAGFGAYHAYVFADGVVTNLNSLVQPGTGLDIAMATGINNAGQIAGWAYDSRGASHAVLLTPVPSGTPILNVADASIVEGHAGTQPATLTVTLSSASADRVTVGYTTANGSAAAGSDYEAVSGILTFDPGQTTRTIAVSVNGDRLGEANETFLVRLSQADGAAIGDGQGVGTIVDDEPRVRIDDVAKKEGNSGTTQFVFTVSLSAATDAPVSVDFATADRTARAGEDYDARSGRLTFSAGEATRTIAVSVKGDRQSEPSEEFSLILSNAIGAFLADNQGIGGIRDDDR